MAGVVLYRVVKGASFDLLAIGHEGDDCQLLEFIEEKEKSDAKSVSKLLALLHRNAENGLSKNIQKVRPLGDKLFEFKTTDGYRVIAFQEGQSLILCTHGFHKKKQKTPPGQIQRAKDLRKEYLEAKESGTLVQAEEDENQ